MQNWQHEIDKAHKGQTGFFKSLKQKPKPKAKSLK